MPSIYNPNNIILTGPPRSGTTLACNLLNDYEDTAALHEPMNLKMFPAQEQALTNIRNFFGEMRTSLLTSGTAISKIKNGEIPDNPFSSKPETGKRRSLVTKGPVKFDKPFKDDFRLVIKHNAHFTFLLHELIKCYPCYVIIRNPVSTIASWNTIEAPVSRGNVNVLKQLNPGLYEEIEHIPDLIDRQVRLLHEHYQNYLSLPPESIIKYEEIIETNGSILQKISQHPNSSPKELTSKNKNTLYDSRLMDRIKQKLNLFDGAYKNWYNKL